MTRPIKVCQNVQNDAPDNISDRDKITRIGEWGIFLQLSSNLFFSKIKFRIT